MLDSVVKIRNNLLSGPDGSERITGSGVGVSATVVAAVRYGEINIHSEEESFDYLARSLPDPELGLNPFLGSLHADDSRGDVRSLAFSSSCVEVTPQVTDTAVS